MCVVFSFLLIFNWEFWVLVRMIGWVLRDCVMEMVNNLIVLGLLIIRFLLVIILFSLVILYMEVFVVMISVVFLFDIVFGMCVRVLM